MAGRPRSFDRDQALDAFVEVFWSRGYDGADVDALQAAAGIQRGSFYATFNDKPSAFVEALRKYMDAVLFPKLTMLSAPGPGALQAFLLFVGDFVSRQGTRGCFLSETLMSAPELKPKLREEVARIRRSLLRTLKQAGGGDGAAAAFALSSALGLHAFARSGASRQQILHAARHAARSVA